MIAWLSREYGNVASVIGLFLTLIAIWNVRSVRKAARAAVWEAASRIQLQMLVAEINQVHHLLERLGEANQTREWSRAADRCIDALSRLERVREHPRLLDVERNELLAVCDDLKTVHGRVEECLKSIAAVRPPRLNQTHRDSVVKSIRILSSIQGRLERAVTGAGNHE